MIDLRQGDCLKIMKSIEANSIDFILTDPPYELGFMNKKWDNTGIAFNVKVWEEAKRILKPGGYLMAFGGTRTYHRMACSIEDAGSGSTGVALEIINKEENTEHKCILIEKDEDHCKIIKKRCCIKE